MSDLTGVLRKTVIPAVPIPFDLDGNVNGRAQETYAQWMATQEVGGVAVWAHTGRGLLLHEDERRTVLEVWVRALGSKPVICGVGVPESGKGIDDAVLMAEHARDGGAQAVMVHPPTALRGSPSMHDRVLEFHSAIAAVGLPVIVFYLYEAAGGIDYPPELVDELLELDGVIGIKLATLDSVMTFQDIASVVLEHRDALLITGEDRFLGYSLMLGSHAVLVGMAAACTDRCVALLDSWFAGDFAAFRRLSASLDAFASATFVEPMEGYVQRMLWALEEDGVIPAAHDRFAPELAEDERQIVRRAVQTLRGPQ